MQDNSLVARLRAHPAREKLVQHAFFCECANTEMAKALAARFIGQWWHPLHYFPTFLARTIVAADTLGTKSATCRILFQELGAGDPAQAHEEIYVSTMRAAGFSIEEITGARPTQATSALVAGYERAAESELTGLGFIYATEVADLAMVSGIGAAVRQAVGDIALPWVDIHVQQEPDHVREAHAALAFQFTETQSMQIVTTAQAAWDLWVGFFDSLHADVASHAGRAFAKSGSISLTSP